MLLQCGLWAWLACAAVDACAAKPPPRNDDFDLFVFAQIYPTAVCVADDDVVPDSCRVPSQAVPWTIHGLWPSRYDDDGPQFCKGADRHFNASLLEPLRHSLEEKWPNLYTQKAVTSLWKHEWEKHGTCARSVDSVCGELNYFGTSLGLLDTSSLAKTLEVKGVTPSLQKTYNASEIVSAISSSFGGRLVLLHCYKDKKNGKWLLADVRQCLDKQLAATDCPNGAKSRSSDKNRRSVRLSDKLPQLQPCPASDIWYLPETVPRKFVSDTAKSLPPVSKTAKSPLSPVSKTMKPTLPSLWRKLIKFFALYFELAVVRPSRLIFAHFI